jgi:hypothetical protein
MELDIEDILDEQKMSQPDREPEIEEPSPEELMEEKDLYDYPVSEPESEPVVKEEPQPEKGDVGPRHLEDQTEENEDLESLIRRLRTWNENCRDLFVDFRSLHYFCDAEDEYIEFDDRNFYDKRIYFKVDPDNPKDPKVQLARKQFCKMLGIPHGFFIANRPSLKMNIVRTWQAGLSGEDDKARIIAKIRESRDCTILRAFTPVTKSIPLLHEIVEIIMRKSETSLILESVHGDGKDDLVFHAEFLLPEILEISGKKMRLGFSLIASELDASPLIFDGLIHDTESRTSAVFSYGADPFFKSKNEGIQATELKEMLPKMIQRIQQDKDVVVGNIEARQEAAGDLIPERDCAVLGRMKGFSAKIRRAVYHEIRECEADISTPLDMARHVGLVAKDLDSLKRIVVERGIGKYLNLVFSRS